MQSWQPQRPVTIQQRFFQSNGEVLKPSRWPIISMTFVLYTHFRLGLAFYPDVKKRIGLEWKYLTFEIEKKIYDCLVEFKILLPKKNNLNRNGSKKPDTNRSNLLRTDFTRFKNINIQNCDFFVFYFLYLVYFSF